MQDGPRLFIGKIETSIDRFNKIDNKFICKNNPTKPHLYLNPFFLPCKNTACLECIYSNFNIFKNLFKCNFDSCNEEHILNNMLEKNTIIEAILKTVVNLVLTNADELIGQKGKFFI